MSAIAYVAYGGLMLVAITAAISDVRTGLVYNKLTYSGILFGLLFWTVCGLMGYRYGIGHSLVGMLAAFLPYALMFSLGGLGGGDVKLMSALGAIAGSWEFVLACTVYALLVSIVMSIAVMLRKGIVKVTLMKLFTTLMLAQSGGKADGGEPLARLPFALAVAVGAGMAGLEFVVGWESPWAWLGP